MRDYYSSIMWKQEQGRVERINNTAWMFQKVDKDQRHQQRSRRISIVLNVFLWR